MAVIVDLAKAARSQAHDNPLARRVWRSIRLKVLLASLVWGAACIVWAMPGLTATAPGPVGTVLATLTSTSCSPFRSLRDPCLYATAWLLPWLFEGSYLASPELRITPLTATERLWGILLPTMAAAVCLGIPSAVTAVVRVASVGIADWKDLGAVALLLAGAAVRAMTVGLCYTTIGLRVLLASHPDGLDKGLAFRRGFGVLWVQFVCEIAGALMAIPFLLLGPRVAAPWMLGAFAVLPLTWWLQLVYTGRMLRVDMNEAEARLFTTEVAERWEERQR